MLLRPRLIAAILLASAFLPGLLHSGYAQASAPQNYALLIGGLGGSDTHSRIFNQHLFETRRALLDRFQFPASNIVVLAEQKTGDMDFVADVSTAENIRAHMTRLASRIGPEDHFYVLLFGHGSYDGERARLNIPRQDLTDTEYGDLLQAINAGRIVFINTASASGPFSEALSLPDRIIVTATRSGTERNETVFPRFLVEALSSPEADLDKDGNLSVYELFAYASQKTERSFEEENHLATEHALIEDTGDGKAYRLQELEASGEGSLASVTYLQRRAAALAGGNLQATREQLTRKEQIEQEIAELKSRKTRLPENQYYAELESLFVQLSRLNETIENTR